MVKERPKYIKILNIVVIFTRHRPVILSKEYVTNAESIYSEFFN